MNCRVAFALALLAAPQGALAQSFNCDNAKTPVEKLICATTELKKLDSALDDAVQSALNTSLAARTKLLVEERAWLSERDRKCAPPAGAPDAEQSKKAVACLTGAYQERIAAVEALVKAQAAARPADRAVCQRIVDSYKSIIADDPKAFFTKETATPMAQTPLTVLEQSPKSGYRLAKPLDEMSEATPKKMEKWAKARQPPFRIPKPLMDAIFEDEPSMLTIERLPGTNYYSTSTTQGTAHCLVSTYFDVKDGVAQRAGDPPWGEGELCGVSQSFGSLDGRPIAVIDNDSLYGPTLGDELVITVWDKDFFRAPCTASFDYEPAFADMESDNAQTADEKCESPVCKALKPQARALVEAVQRHPLEARKAALAGVTEAQRKSFDEMEKLSPRDKYAEPETPEDAAQPASYREDGPLLAPLVHDGELYLARIGHTTMGWRTFADWSVRFDRLEKGALQTVGTAYVSMTPGKLRSANVR